MAQKHLTHAAYSKARNSEVTGNCSQKFSRVPNFSAQDLGRACIGAAG